jgi:DNA-binding MarR family transcriptional regulator
VIEQGNYILYHPAMALRLRTTEASETFSALWAAVSRLNEILAEEMYAETGMSLERYGILLRLAQAENGAMRPSELADCLPLTRSGTTRLVDRLVADGLVERRSHETDGRGFLVALTTEGEESFRKAGRVHLRGIDEHVGEPLTEDEMKELRRILRKISRGTDDLEAD